VVGVAKAMVSSGLAAAGYTIVALDDCYLATERVDGRLVAGPTFPSGMKNLGDSLHSMGLKFGVCVHVTPLFITSHAQQFACKLSARTCIRQLAKMHVSKTTPSHYHSSVNSQ
jgi:hypothetical protein